MWKGDAVTVRAPKSAVLAKGATTIVALLQSGHIGPVLGAARLDSITG